ncbi:MAG TPA: acyl carrier protein, partial [Candidatus Coproplasma excrementipullorum]|nr:acyl carrier protein [Candidatus Coproplasma excrementipullorum]
DDLGADSLDIVEMLMTLEDTTGKTIPDEKVTEIKTVGDLVDVLNSL